MKTLFRTLLRIAGAISLALPLCAAEKGSAPPSGKAKKADSASWVKTGRPVQLTHGEGNDMEAAVGPDGRIAYENDAADGVIENGAADGVMRIYVMSPSGTQPEAIAGGGKGVMAAYPAWTPDGGLVYALSAPTGTAAVQVPAGGDIGCNLWLWKNGDHTRLTKGLWRDFTPSVSPDGKTVWFTTSRGRQRVGDGSHLASLKLAETGFPVTENKDIAYVGGAAAVSPVLSPRGRILAWAQADNAFANWVIMLGDAADPSRNCRLTDGAKMNCYAPRWSPDGEVIACTGYRVGDPGWSIYLIHLASGSIARLDGGRGNSKSPCWTPDGQAIVYENNATGSYKLYRMSVKLTLPTTAMASRKPIPCRVTGMWLPPGTDGKSYWNASDRGAVEGKRAGEGAYSFGNPGGLEFGKNPYYLKASFIQTAVSGNPKIIAVGNYSFAPGVRVWQLYVDSANRLRFSARGQNNMYVDVMLGEPLKLNTEYTAVGVHYPDGRMRLMLAGGKPVTTVVEAGEPLVGAYSLSIGTAGSADSRFLGKVLGFECGIGEPPEMPKEVSVASLLKLERRSSDAE